MGNEHTLLKNRRVPCILDPAEYAKIRSEINTYYNKYKGKPVAAHLSYGLDNIAYTYIFENYGFDDYNIFMKAEINN